MDGNEENGTIKRRGWCTDGDGASSLWLGIAKRLADGEKTVEICKGSQHTEYKEDELQKRKKLCEEEGEIRAAHVKYGGINSMWAFG